MRRRSFLAAAPIALSASLLPSVATADAEMTEYESTQPIRGEREVALDVVDEEDDEYIEYLDEDDEVRFVEAWVAGEPTEEPADEPPEREPRFTTTPWEEWAKRRCKMAAAEKAADEVETELDHDDVSVGHGISSRVPEKETAAVITIHDIDDQLGLDRESAAALTPATVDATYKLDDQQFDHEVEIFARLEQEAAETDDGQADESDQPTAGSETAPGFGFATVGGAVLSWLFARRIVGSTGDSNSSE